MVEAARDLFHASVTASGAALGAALVAVALYYGLAPLIARILRDRS